MTKGETIYTHAKLRPEIRSTSIIFFKFLVFLLTSNLGEEGFEGISTVRYSYLAESTGSCRDQVGPTLCHGQKLRFEENSMQSSEAVLALNFE